MFHPGEEICFCPVIHTLGILVVLVGVVVVHVDLCVLVLFQRQLLFCTLLWCLKK